MAPLKRKSPNATAKADVLFSRLVRDRDQMCVRCGTVNNLQCAHIWSRRYRALRWRFENAVTLCSGCHMYFTLRPAEWAEWCEGQRFGEEGLTTGKIRMVQAMPEYAEELGWTYQQLRFRALNDPPEKAVDALARLKAVVA